MKKIILLAAVAFAFMGTACRKERTCECKTTTTQVRTGFGAKTTITTQSTKVTVEKQKKSSFKYISDCFSTKTTDQYSAGNGGTAYTVETTDDTACELN